MNATPRPLAEIADRFNRFARTEASGVSPLYHELAQAVAKDEDMLVLATYARPGQPLANMLFGAVHFLLLGGKEHPLSKFYASGTESPAPAAEAFPAFKSFCEEHHASIQRILQDRMIQTNEVSRCCSLLPGFAVVQRRTSGDPWFLADIGASAGLNLIWDRYRYDFGRERMWGPSTSELKLTCEQRGSKTPPFPEAAIRILSRIRIDLNPVSLENPEERLWLEALIWPEHRDRAERLSHGMDVLRKDPPPILKGEAVELLARLLDETPRGLTRCLVSSFTINQIPQEGRDRMEAALARQGQREAVYLLSLGFVRSDDVELRLTTYEKGESREERLARCAPHGDWIEWLGD